MIERYDNVYRRCRIDFKEILKVRSRITQGDFPIRLEHLTFLSHVSKSNACHALSFPMEELANHIKYLRDNDSFSERFKRENDFYNSKPYGEGVLLRRRVGLGQITLSDAKLEQILGLRELLFVFGREIFPEQIVSIPDLPEIGTTPYLLPFFVVTEVTNSSREYYLTSERDFTLQFGSLSTKEIDALFERNITRISPSSTPNLGSKQREKDFRKLRRERLSFDYGSQILMEELEDGTYLSPVYLRKWPHPTIRFGRNTNLRSRPKPEEYFLATTNPNEISILTERLLFGKKMPSSYRSLRSLFGGIIIEGDTRNTGYFIGGGIFEPRLIINPLNFDGRECNSSLKLTYGRKVKTFLEELECIILKNIDERGIRTITTEDPEYFHRYRRTGIDSDAWDEPRYAHPERRYHSKAKEIKPLICLMPRGRYSL
ncbi:hypothetical protein HN385_04955 [archaeon]|jgi:hypothetical protein|nr:hypothetical protein [archaeon]MBT3465045.1 hypothetical protein [archaeon]MBT6869282.1 hypothetical protein [archaeon]MBT7193680.1 hypothetical protein [archaeon]MBT7381208.1 hypothetical protein [archaeon]